MISYCRYLYTTIIILTLVIVLPARLYAFTDSGQSIGSGNVLSAAVGDIDGDGDPDLITGLNTLGDKLFLNSGGTLTDSGQALDPGDTSGIFIFDVDGDGDLDYVAGNLNGNGGLWLNDGTGTFSDSGLSVGNSTYSFYAVDLDMDGDYDLLEGTDNGVSNKAWLNNGGGVFTDSGRSFDTSTYAAVAGSDLDGDGDTDFVAAVLGSLPNKVWKNNGTGIFTDSGQTLGACDSSSVAIYDFDADGDADVFFGNVGASNTVWLNDGSGVLTDSGQATGASDTYSVAGADMDGDGDYDVISGNANPISGMPNTFWINNGSGVFTDSGEEIGDNDSFAIALSDFDADGDIDIFDGNLSASSALFINDNNHANTTPTAPPLTAEPDIVILEATAAITLEWGAGSDAEAADTDLLTYDLRVGTSAGACDVYCGTFPTVGVSPYHSVLPGNAGAALSHIVALATGTYYWSVRTVDTTYKASAWSVDDSFIVRPIYTDSGQSFDGANTFAVHPLDADGDGDVDFIETIYLDDDVLWKNDGAGTFTKVTQVWNDMNELDGCTADIDGDGDIDFISANNAAQSNRVWKNDGSGTFTDTGQALGSGRTYDCVTVDVDSDGDYDLVAANENGDPNKLYKNNGTGVFSDTLQSMGAEYTMEVVAGDFDDDGDEDVVFANRYAPSQLWLNDGTGALTDSGQAIGSDEARSVFAADTDADGDADILIGYDNATDRIFINDGSATFSDSGQSLVSPKTRSVHVIDVDIDGDLDIIAGNYNAGDKVWYNDGSGNFNDSFMSLGTGETQSIFAVDVDGDGDTDIIEGNSSGEGCAVWENILDPSNTAPSAPSITTKADTIIPGTATVTFEWSDGSDPETADADLLTYDIRIGTSSGGCEAFCGSLPWSGAVPWRNTGPGAMGATGSFSIIMSTGTYYWSMRTVDPASLAGAWGTEDSFVLIQDDAAAPTVIDNQDGDDTWRNAAGTTYDVDFADTGDSLLDNVQYTIWSAASMAGTELVSWTDIADNIDSISYTTDWEIDFESATSGVNYVSVRAFDNFGNVSDVATDVFYVKKETSPPTVTDNQGGDAIWRNAAGTTYDVDFADTGGSQLADVQYTIYDGAGQGGSMILGWSGIATGVDADSYTTDWQIDFNAAATGTNYVSVRATDNAGNISAVATDVFYVKKDTALPTIDDQVSGDDNWYAADPGAIYNVDFNDSGGSMLSAASYTVYTGTGMSGSQVISWATIAAGIGSDSYTDNWGIDFASLPFGISYISVRAADNAQNSSGVVQDVFYVRKTQIAMSLSSYPSGSNNTTDIKAGDLDGDGDLDIIEGNTAQTNMVWLGDGTGGFTQLVSVMGSYYTQSVFIADLDNDGDLDVVCGNASAGDVKNRVWFNDGVANFTDAGLNDSLGSSDTMSVFAADLDRDGDMDFIAGNYAQADKVWINDGAGAFADSGQSLGSYNTNSIFGIDVDGDGDMDFIEGNNGADRILLNDGAASFTDSGQSLGLADTKHIYSTDIDADGDADIIAANYGDDKIWLNDGGGMFTDSGQSLSSGLTDSFAAGDLDGDGDSDFITGRDGTDYIWINDGSGTFSANAQTFLSIPSDAVEALDMDGDGDLDIYVGRYQSNNRVYINNNNHANAAPIAPALVGEPTQELSSDDAVDVTLEWTGGSDAETGDTDLLTYDVRVGTTGGGCEVFCGWFPKTAAWLGHRPGNAGATHGISLSLPLGSYYWSVRTVDTTFKASSWAAEDTFTLFRPVFVDSGQELGSGDTNELCVADFTGNGHMDFVAVDDSSNDLLWVNFENGTFSDSGQGMNAAYSVDVSCADIDGDSDIDYIVALSGNSNIVWKNNGTGTFSQSTSFDSSDTEGVVFADVDNDGDVDVIDGNSGTGNTVFLNDGSGSFSDSGQSLGVSNTTDVFIADLDSDGDKDIYESNDGAGNVVWMNDGTGVFSDSGQSLGTDTTTKSFGADVDGDGDIDMIEGNTPGAPNRVRINDGAGVFSGTGGEYGGSDTTAVYPGDIDVDGDYDFIAGNTAQGNVVWFNSAGVFSDAGNSLGSSLTNTVVLVDVDGDGGLDYIEGNGSGPDRIWFNNLDTPNTNPSPPAPTAQPDYETASMTVSVTLEWPDGTDAETAAAGLLTYEVRVGTSSGACDILCAAKERNLTAGPGSGPGVFGPMNTLDLDLASGTYYWSLRTVDPTYYRSAWSAEDSFSITVDSTAPSTITTVNDGLGDDIDFSTDTASFSANWSEAADGETSIARYWYSIGTSAGASDTVGWTDNGTATSVTVTGLSLTGGLTYYISVKAENGAGLIGNPAVSDGLLVDGTLPSAVAFVYDGAVDGADIDFSSSSSRLSANWATSSDDETSIAGYWYSIGTNAGASDTVPWTDNAASTSVTLSSLSLANGQTYFFSVKAENGAGAFGSVETSDGATVDWTAPDAVLVVYDGTGADIDYSTDTTQLSANWSAASDPESGILSYTYSIGTTVGACDVVSWTDNASGTSVTHTGLSLADGQVYFFSVRALNYAGLYSSKVFSDGVTINISGPGEVADLMADPAISEILLSWTNPADTDFAGTIIMRSQVSYPSNASEGTRICDEATNEFCTDETSLAQGLTYYYSAFAYDIAGNYSTAAGEGARATASLITPGLTIYSGWNAAGISLDQVYIDLAAVFPSGDYTIIRCDGPVTNYDGYINATGTIQLDYAGGYWIFSGEDIGVVDYTGGNAQTENYYQISLAAGWNMFSLPYNSEIEWNDTNAALECGGTGTSLPTVYYYDNSTGEYTEIEGGAGKSLMPWRGYWVEVNESCTLTINKPQ